MEKKWKNVLQSYKKYIDNMKSTGRGAIRKPDFFLEIEEIVGGVDELRFRKSGIYYEVDVGQNEVWMGKVSSHQCLWSVT